MATVLGILLGIAVIAIIILAIQVAPASARADRADKEVESLKGRLSEAEQEQRKASEALSMKRRETEELKERVRDVKRKRQEEREVDRFQKELSRAREEIERDMEKKLALAREEAEMARDQMKRLSSEMEALRSRRPVAQASAQTSSEAPVAERKPREPRPEELVRLEVAEKGLKETRARMHELDEEVKRQKGRAETDRRVFLVQKKEIELAKDKFRALETKHNALIRERDEIQLSRYELEKQLRALMPTAPVAEKPASAGAAASGEVKVEEKPAAAPVVAEQKPQVAE